MFKWFKRSIFCYVFMSDVHDQLEMPGIPENGEGELVADIAINFDKSKHP